jgi:hypothetical protein
MKVGVLAIMMVMLLPFAAAAGPAVDSDSDGTVDVLDFCSADPSAPAPCGFDTDTDGYGNACDGDYNQDGVVNAGDAGPLIADLASGIDSGVGTDMNCDGVVNAGDVAPFLSQSSQGVPGPSGLPCAGTVPCP